MHRCHAWRYSDAVDCLLAGCDISRPRLDPEREPHGHNSVYLHCADYFGIDGNRNDTLPSSLQLWNRHARCPSSRSWLKSIPAMACHSASASMVHASSAHVSKGRLVEKPLALPYHFSPLLYGRQIGFPHCPVDFCGRSRRLKTIGQQKSL